MNERFTLLPGEKQQKILNAAYKVFARNEYKKAPMSEIAQEGDISKSLLFHYFVNKADLYGHLWEHALKMTSQAMKKYKVYETSDFFEMLRRGLYAKCDLMRSYQYLYPFTMRAYYEEWPEAKEKIQVSYQQATEQSRQLVLQKIDFSRLREDVIFESMYQEILWASDGFMNQKFRAGDWNIDEFEKEYLALVSYWETLYEKKNEK